MWEYNYSPNSDELYHYGVLGMKWGHHKYSSSAGQTLNKAKSEYKNAKKQYGKSFNDAYKHNAVIGKKRRAESEKKWNKAFDDADSLVNAKKQYTKAKKEYKIDKNVQKNNMLIAKNEYKNAKKQYGESFNDAYKNNAVIGKKRVEASREKWNKAINDADILKKAKKGYEIAKKQYKSY